MNNLKLVNFLEPWGGGGQCQTRPTGEEGGFPNLLKEEDQEEDEEEKKEDDNDEEEMEGKRR